MNCLIILRRRTDVEKMRTLFFSLGSECHSSRSLTSTWQLIGCLDQSRRTIHLPQFAGSLKSMPAPTIHSLKRFATFVLVRIVDVPGL